MIGSRDPLYFKGISLKFESRDLWLGIYWDYKNDGHKFGKWQRSPDVFICILPTLPIILRWHT